MTITIAVYTRVSREDVDEPLSTRRQERACRDFAQSKGWRISSVWEDVDVSAYEKRRRRPSFEQLLAIVAGGKVDGVLVWKLDRLVRRMNDFERFWVRCDRAGVFLASATEPIDTSTEMGLALVRILVTFANIESTTIGLRLRARLEEKARSGIPIRHSRDFGFNPTWTEVQEDEAALIREAADRVIAGCLPKAIAMEWNDQGVTAPDGGAWTPYRVRRLLASPRLAGHNTFMGSVIKEECFPAILDPVTSAKLRAKFAEMWRDRRPRSQYILSGGLIRCGICGRPMHRLQAVEHPRSGQPMPAFYKCAFRPLAHYLTIDAAFVESLVVAWTLDRIERRARQRPSLQMPEGAPQALAHAYDEHAATLRELSRDFYVNRKLSREEWEAARNGLEEALRDVRRRLEPGWAPDAESAARHARTLRTSWSRLTIDHQRDIVASELRFVTIEPAEVKGTIDSRRVEPTWHAADPGFAERSQPPAGARRMSPWDNTYWAGTGEAAQLLGISREAVLAMIHRGQLPTVRAHRHYRIARSDLDQLLGKLPMLSLSDVRKEMGVCDRTVWRWVSLGWLPVEPWNGRRMVRRDAYERLSRLLCEVDQKLITTQEASRILGLKAETVAGMARSGKLQAFHSWRGLLFDKAKVEAEESDRRQRNRISSRAH